MFQWVWDTVFRRGRDISERVLLLWVKLIRKQWHIRKLQRLWAEVGQWLQSQDAELRLRLRQIYLPPSGIRPRH
jgi:hypothetical protein